MAKSNKSQSKTFKQKVNKVVEGDIFKSLAVASVLLNILFLVSVFVLTSTDTFDRGVYQAAKNRYCQNVTGVQQRAKELGDDQKALNEWRVTCVSKEFKPFYNEAVEKFNAQNHQ